MERTNHWAALYFILLMTFGNYVLFNLLVAILAEGFKCQNDLFVDCYSDDEEDFYTDSDEDDFEETPEHDNISQTFDNKKGLITISILRIRTESKIIFSKEKKGYASALYKM